MCGTLFASSCSLPPEREAFLLPPHDSVGAFFFCFVVLFFYCFCFFFTRTSLSARALLSIYACSVPSTPDEFDDLHGDHVPIHPPLVKLFTIARTCGPNTLLVPRNPPLHDTPCYPL